MRCLKVLMAGQGYPMVATHDPRLVEIAASLARRYGRGQGTYEYQMLFGVRPEEQRRLAAPARRCASTCPTARSGTATSCGGSPSAREPGFFLRSLISKK